MIKENGWCYWLSFLLPWQRAWKRPSMCVRILAATICSLPQGVCTQANVCLGVIHAQPRLQSDWKWKYLLCCTQEGPTCPLKASMMKWSACGWTHSIHFCTTWLPFWSFTHFRTWPSNSRTISLCREQQEDDGRQRGQRRGTCHCLEKSNIA